jgi:hypothetical protein
MIYLRQSTASQEIPLGYFVDSTDGNTEETALTIANTDIKLWKTGATTLASKNSGGATHISNGIYYAVLDATDTDTIGPMVIFCHMTGALTTRLECCVLDEAVYDVLMGTTALSTYAGADTSGTTTLLSRIGSALTITTGKVDVNDKTGFGLSAAAVQAIWDALTTALTTAGSIGKRLADNVDATISSRLATAGYTAPLDAAGTRSAVGLAAANLDTQLTAIDDYIDTEVAAILAAVDTEVAAIKAKTDNLPASPAASGDAMALTAAAVDAILDDAVDGSTTLRQLLRGFASALMGKLAGAATTTITMRDLADTKNRVTATVDADGNRSAVTLDLT